MSRQTIHTCDGCDLETFGPVDWFHVKVQEPDAPNGITKKFDFCHWSCLVNGLETYGDAKGWD